jgi:hypothetical protein
LPRIRLTPEKIILRPNSLNQGRTWPIIYSVLWQSKDIWSQKWSGQGKAQTIALPLPVNTSALDAEDQKNVQEEAIMAIVKRKSKLDGALKKGYATIWDQYSQEVRNKLEVSND